MCIRDRTVTEENLAPVVPEPEPKKEEAPKVETKEAKKEEVPKVEVQKKTESLSEKK